VALQTRLKYSLGVTMRVFQNIEHEAEVLYAAALLPWTLQTSAQNGMIRR